MRADSLATRYLFHPLSRIRPRKKGRVPILMYHGVSNADHRGKHPYFETTTSPAVFAQHMQFLFGNGYSPLSLDEALAYLDKDDRNTRKPVVITFDDGYLNFYTEAFPILQRYRFTATMFLPTAFIGTDRQRFNDSDCLTWRQIRELHQAGINFGAHTVTHPQLRGMEDKAIHGELRCSKQKIEDEVQCPVTSFAYPYAFPETDRLFRQMLRAVLEETGYDHGVSTIIGTADSTNDRFFMPRLPVNSWDDLPLFGAKLEGGYDWLHTVQYVRKRFAKGRSN